MKKIFTLILLPFFFSSAFTQNIGINTTGAAPNSLNMFEVLQISTTANSVGIYSGHTGNITGTAYGFKSLVSGTSTTNVAGNFSATGATTNYAAIFENGYVRKDFTAASGGTSYWALVNNDGVGNIHQYINTLGTAAPTFITNGSAYDWMVYQLNTAGGAGNAMTLRYANPGVAGGPITWKNALVLDAENNHLTLMPTGAGNVGIGLTPPSYQLHVSAASAWSAKFASTAAGNGGIYVDAASGFNANIALQENAVDKWYLGNRASNDRFSFIDGSGATEVVTILQGGNVGIGTNNPGEKLEIVGTGTGIYLNSATSNLIRYNTNGVAPPAFTTRSAGTKLVFYPQINATNVDYAIGIDGSTLWFSVPQNIAGYAHKFYGGTTEVMRIRGDGNVGIGTTSPDTKLHVAGGNGTTLKIVDGNQAAGKILTSDAAGVASWANPAAGTMVLLYNNETSVSGFTYANTTAFTYNVVGTFSQVKVEADIENDCSGGATVGLQGWDYKIVYNGVTKRTAQLWCHDTNTLEGIDRNNDWLSGHVTYMGAVANGQTVKIDVINQGTAGTWYVRNFRVWGIY